MHTIFSKTLGRAARAVAIPILMLLLPVGSTFGQGGATADLSLAFGPLSIPLDSTFETNLVVTNLGPDVATEVSVEVFTYQIDTTSAGVSCSPTQNGSLCMIATLQPGENAVFRSDEDAFDLPTTFWVVASVTTAGTTDPDPSNNSLDLQVPVGYDQITSVLVPLAIERSTPGAQNTYWRADFTAFIAGDTDTFFFPLKATQCSFGVCPAIAMYPVQPRKRWEPALYLNPAFPGYMLHFDKRSESDVFFAHRVRETSKVNDPWGTEIPVVFERDWTRGTINLLDIPAESRYRRTLRVYQPDGLQSEVRVRAYGGIFSDELIAEETFPVNASAWGDFNGKPVYAGYAQIDIDAVFGALSPAGRIRFEIEPTNDLRHWAFISITNNDTQHFTIVTPQQHP